LNLTLRFAFFRFQVFRNHISITHFWKIFLTKFTKEHHPWNSKAGVGVS